MTGSYAQPIMDADIAAFAHARDEVLGRIAAACVRAGRDPSGVTLVAVSKTASADRVRAAVAAGLTVLGENRVQEAAVKAPEVPGAVWHLVGPLQSNKARRAVELFAVIETVDSIDLAVRLDRLAAELRPGRPLPVLLQVNVDADPAKAGFAPEATPAAAAALLALPNLRVDGLMTIGRVALTPDDARATFRELRELAAVVRALHPAVGPELSMGMTDDFEVAVEEGATIVRVGRALFGDRSAAGPVAGDPRAAGR
jgi:pyridoxal phosphate enzyme (YggS family)